MTATAAPVELSVGEWASAGCADPGDGPPGWYDELCDRGSQIPGWLVGAEPVSWAAPSGFLADVLADVDLPQLPDPILVEHVVAWERLAGWVAARQARAVAAFADRMSQPEPPLPPEMHTPELEALDQAFDLDPVRVAGVELGAALGLTSHGGENRVLDALDLRDRLPATLDALEAGTITAYKAAILAGETRYLGADGQSPALAGIESAAIARAATSTPAQLRAWTARKVARADSTAVTRRRKTAVADRGVWLHPSPWDGTSTLGASLAADDAAACWAAIDSLARAASDPDPAGDSHDAKATAGSPCPEQAAHPDASVRRTLDQRRADALVDLLTGRSATGCTPIINVDVIIPAPAAAARAAEPGSSDQRGGRGRSSSGAGSRMDAGRSHGTRPTMTAPPAPPHPSTADDQAAAEQTESGPIADSPQAPTAGGPPTAELTGYGPPMAELTGYGPIDADLTRDLLVRGRWRRILTDPLTGTVLDVGRHRYTPPAALADLIRIRDKTCRFPGCRRQAASCELDHTIAYPTGPTAATNLACLCKRHHRIKHRAGWNPRLDADGTMHWTSPHRRSYTTHPDHENHDPPQTTAPDRSQQHKPRRENSYAQLPTEPPF